MPMVVPRVLPGLRVGCIEESPVSCRTSNDTRNESLEPCTYSGVHCQLSRTTQLGTPVALEVATPRPAWCLEVHAAGATEKVEGRLEMSKRSILVVDDDQSV